MRISKFYKVGGPILCAALLMACGETPVTSELIGPRLKELVEAGYTLEELSLRTGYSTEQLHEAYLQDQEVLRDSVANAQLLQIAAWNAEERIIPIRKVDLTAESALWEIQHQATNVAQIAWYTGIGIYEVKRTLSNRIPLSPADSLKAMLAYVNFRYGLKEIPTSFEHYFNPQTSLDNVTVAVNFEPQVTDEVKRKIDYYLYLARQWELKANKRLKDSIKKKTEQHLRKAIDDFFSDEISGPFNTSVNSLQSLWTDSAEIAQKFNRKLEEHLALEDLSQNINDEMLNYCISVNCSRILVVNEVLQCPRTSQLIPPAQRLELHRSLQEMETLNELLRTQGINVSADVLSTGSFITLVQQSPRLLALASKTGGPVGWGFALMLEVAQLAVDQIIKETVDYDENEVVIEEVTHQLKEKLRQEQQFQIEHTLEGEDGIFEELGRETDAYYQQLREVYHL